MDSCSTLLKADEETMVHPDPSLILPRQVLRRSRASPKDQLSDNAGGSSKRRARNCPFNQEKAGRFHTKGWRGVRQLRGGGYP
jgi:hypothetical protein